MTANSAQSQAPAPGPSDPSSPTTLINVNPLPNENLLEISEQDEAIEDVVNSLFAGETLNVLQVGSRRLDCRYARILSTGEVMLIVQREKQNFLSKAWGLSDNLYGQLDAIEDERDREKDQEAKEGDNPDVKSVLVTLESVEDPRTRNMVELVTVPATRAGMTPVDCVMLTDRPPGENKGSRFGEQRLYAVQRLEEGAAGGSGFGVAFAQTEAKDFVRCVPFDKMEEGAGGYEISFALASSSVRLTQAHVFMSSCINACFSLVRCAYVCGNIHDISEPLFKTGSSYN